MNIIKKRFNSIVIEDGSEILFDMSKWPVMENGNPYSKEEVEWNGSIVIITSPSNKINKYKKKQFKKLNNYISQNICYIKSGTNFGQVLSQFNSGLSATYTTNMEIDIAINNILVNLFDTFDFNGGSL